MSLAGQVGRLVLLEEETLRIVQGLRIFFQKLKNLLRMPKARKISVFSDFADGSAPFVKTLQAENRKLVDWAN